MPTNPIFYAVAAVILAAAMVIAFFLGKKASEKSAEKNLNNAQSRAKSILADAQKKAEEAKREALIEAKEKIHNERTEFQRELKTSRSEITKLEDQLRQKESNLDKKADNLEHRTEQLAQKVEQTERAQAKIEELKNAQIAELERISAMSSEEAKAQLLKSLEDKITHEAAVKLREIESRLHEEADAKAREVISLAIGRVASDQVVESTVNSVAVPNDDMKGRIIGREGRNIRTIENLTGVDLIIDDTPEAITISCFDPVRREIARLLMEKLLLDGRIHPARIEEMYAKCKKEVESTVKAEGERAALETGIHGLHPELIRLLGRLRYRTSYGQNVLAHSIEVAHLSGIMAAELGIDETAAKRAGLLHDIGKAIDHEVEGTHVQIGVDIAKRYNEKPAVIHAIEAHHGDVEPHTVAACLVQAADAISASRPGARRDTIQNYVKRLENLEKLTQSFAGVTSSYAISAGREIRVMVEPEKISEDEMLILARDIANKIEAELQYPGQIKVNLFRETRAVEYAK